MNERIMRTMMRVANSPRLLVACIIGNVVGSGLVYAAIEHKGPITSMWWAVVTGSTTGYGDQYPKTTPGRAVGVWLIATSILLVAVGTAQLASKLIVDRNVFTNEEQEELKHNIQVIAQMLCHGNVVDGGCCCVWNDADTPVLVNPACKIHGKDARVTA